MVMSRCASDYGAYHPQLRRIVMNSGLGLGTLTHELVHPIVETDFPNAPSWITRALRRCTKAPVIPRPGEIHGRKNWRYPRLIKALADPGERDQVGLEHLFSLDDSEFRGAQKDLHYAVARYACQWLDEQRQLWRFYRAWRDGFDNDASGE